MTRIAGANSRQPYLGIRNPSQKAVRGSEFITVYLVGSGFDIDGNEFTLVPLFQNRAKLILINRIPEVGFSSDYVNFLNIYQPSVLYQTLYRRT